MKLSVISAPLSLLALAAIASPAVMADDHGWYLGGSLGQSMGYVDKDGVQDRLQRGGFGTTDFDRDDHDLGYKLFTGYRFNRHFALEGGYFDLGEFDYEATTFPPGSQSGTFEARGVNLDAVGILPITDRFSAFGRIGSTYAESRARYSSTGLAPQPRNNKDSDWNPKIGAGVQYDFSDTWAMRAELERYRFNDAVGFEEDIDMASLGLVYSFAAMAPVYVPPPVAAPPPPPAPVRVVAAPKPAPPPPPPPTKVAFSADALFDFDKATLKPAGKHVLNAFAADLRGTRFDVIRVTGHTDRLGSHEYNLALSDRRAKAVKDYLVTMARVPPNRILTRGVDGAEPVTRPGECRGNTATRALIACLQPDRRVEVEVTGTSTR